MNNTLVEVESAAPAISVITLNRPEKRNALSLALIEQITAAIERTQSDRARRVAILRANGPAFCAGLDLKEAAQPQGTQQSAQALARMYQTICGSPLIVIAAAQGAAMGGGAGLVLACDFVLAADDTFRLGFPEVHRGLVAALVTVLLRRQVNDRVARELVMLGQTLDAPTALKLALINRGVPEKRLAKEAMSLARDLCRGAPNAMVRSKRLLEEQGIRPMREELDRALQHHLDARHSPEAMEGMAAFAEKRTPKWGMRD